MSQHLYTETTQDLPIAHQTTVLHHYSKNHTATDGILHSLVFDAKDSGVPIHYQDSNPTVIRRDSSDGEIAAALAPLSSDRHRLDQ